MDFKKIEATKKAQEEAKKAVRKAHYVATLFMSVGSGKGKLMIDLAQELIEKYNIKSILYVCDSRRLRDSSVEGFPEQLEKWGTPELKKLIRLECYQTACKWENENYDLLLADEADFGVTKVYSNVFFKNRYRFKLLFTGTMSSEKKKIIKTIAPIVYTLTTIEAEDRNILNKSKYYIYNYRMNDAESKSYLKWTKAIALAYQDDKEIKTIHFLTNRRRELLSSLTSSYLNCRKIMQWLWKRDRKTRLVIFCNRRDQADRVCRWSYHGDNEQDDNLAKFQLEEISAIAVVAKIKRGINLKNANTGLYESLPGGSTTEFEQRNGRLKRLPLSELAHIIFMLPWYKTKDKNGNVIYKPTIVQEWIHSSTLNITNINFITLKL